MRNLFALLACIISFVMPITTAWGETKQYALDFTNMQTLPDGWVKGSKVDFKSAGDINCLFFGIRGGSTYDYILSSPVFYKVTRISVWVEKIDRNTSFTLYFESPTGEMLQSNLYENTYASTSRQEIIFENNNENPFPDNNTTNYCISLFADNVYVSSITITYEERPQDEDNVTAFILKNHFGDDDTSLSWIDLAAGNVQIAFSGTAQYISSLHYAQLKDDGCIIITAPHITKVEAATNFLGETIMMNGTETSTWEGDADKVELTPPSGGQSCITAIAVYTSNDSQSAAMPIQVPRAAYARGLQNKIIIDGTYDKADIFNTAGTLIKSLADGTGQTAITIDAGCYIIRFSNGNHVFSRKVIVR